MSLTPLISSTLIALAIIIGLLLGIGLIILIIVAYMGDPYNDRLDDYLNHQDESEGQK